MIIQVLTQTVLSNISTSFASVLLKEAFASDGDLNEDGDSFYNDTDVNINDVGDGHGGGDYGDDSGDGGDLGKVSVKEVDRWQW